MAVIVIKLAFDERPVTDEWHNWRKTNEPRGEREPKYCVGGEHGDDDIYGEWT